ncbi:hypothetical protein ACX5K5_15290 [Glutamicibacter bergerei]
MPGRSDAFLRKFTELIVGPLGKHSNPGWINPGFITIERVLLLLTVVAALLAVASKSTCRLSLLFELDRVPQRPRVHRERVLALRRGRRIRIPGADVRCYLGDGNTNFGR